MRPADWREVVAIYTARRGKFPDELLRYPWSRIMRWWSWDDLALGSDA